MNYLQLKNKDFINYINGFTSWLKTLGYAKSTVERSPVYLKEFLYYLEQNNIITIDRVNNHITKDYFVYLSRRKNITKPGALSTYTLRNHFSALRRFGKYFRETGQGNIDVSVNLPVNQIKIKNFLTKREIRLLYEATDTTALGLRDKAMLSIYYGCGLRRNEGANLDIKDIHLESNKIFVRKGKGYVECFVPITETVKTDLESYLKYARIVLTLENPAEASFFVNVRGKRISGSMLYERLQQLKEKAGIIKEVGLHTLRHSIATHLLKDGMEIEMVSRFLGHSSLESTQIYTHLSAETQ